MTTSRFANAKMEPKFSPASSQMPSPLPSVAPSVRQSEVGSPTPADGDARSFVSSDPLHGITLETVVTRLVAHFGWRELGHRIEIRCFNFDPSVKSSLQFLRRTPWARKKVEELYVREFGGVSNRLKQN